MNLIKIRNFQTENIFDEKATKLGLKFSAEICMDSEVVSHYLG